MSDNNKNEKRLSSAFSIPVMVAACLLSAAGALFVNIMPIFLGSAAEQMSLNDQQIGLLGSAYLAGFAIVAAASPFWIIRFNWQRLAFCSFVAVISLLVICAYSDQHSELLALLIGIGMGGGILYTLGIAIIAQCKDPDRGFGFKMVAEIGSGIILMIVLPAYVMEQWGFQGVIGGIALMLTVFAFAVIWLPKQGLSQQLSDTTSSPEVPGGSKLAAWIGLITFLVFFSGINGVWAFIERVGNDIGMDSVAIGNVLSLSLFMGGIGALVAGILGNRFGRMLPLIVGHLAMAFAVFLLATRGDHLSYAIAVCLIMGFWPFVMAYQMGLVVSADSTGRITVLISAALASGGAIGPGIAGFLKTGESYLPVYMMSGVLTLLSLAAFLWLAVHLHRSRSLRQVVSFAAV